MNRTRELVGACSNPNHQEHLEEIEKRLQGMSRITIWWRAENQSFTSYYISVVSNAILSQIFLLHHEVVSNCVTRRFSHSMFRHW